MNIQPFASLRADYANSSYFETNLHRDRGQISVPYDDAHRTIVDYVTSVLSKWEKADTSSPPVVYMVYLSFTATFDDGRKANRTANHASFATLELALKHTSERSDTLLRELDQVRMDNL